MQTLIRKEKSDPMKGDPVLSLLGIAQKAGCVKSGEFMTESMIREGKAYLCIISGDASDNTKKKFRDMCSYRNVTLAEYSGMEELGHAIGKDFRSSLCVTDEKLAQKLHDKILNNSR